MKNFIYTLTAVFVLASCTNVKKLVEQGRYEEAFEYAAKKLAGKKNKKTDHVMALEDAYARLVERDLNTISHLQSKNRPELQSSIYRLYEGLMRRQDRISAFLPLISKDGYAAHFIMKNYSNDMKLAADKASEFHYTQAISLLENAKLGHKLDARAAYRELNNINRFYPFYKKKDSLLQVADALGMTHVLIETSITFPGNIEGRFIHDLLDLDYLDMNSRWVQYYWNQPEGIPMDIKAELRYEVLNTSPELIASDRYTCEKEIKVGTRKYYETETKVDSSGNHYNVKVEKEEDVFETVRSVTTITTMDKQAQVIAVAEYIDYITGEVYGYEEFEAQHIFQEEYSEYSGDERADCGDAPRVARGGPGLFPSDRTMWLAASRDIKRAFMAKNEQEIL